MNDIEKLQLTVNSSIKQALAIIDKGAIRIALVVDKDKKLIGTLTDGDIRRAILDGKELDGVIENIYCKNPTVVHVNDSKEDIINICTLKKIYQVPIVDNTGKVVGVNILDELVKPTRKENRVILMAGGLGTRLKPLTDKVPKPMLQVGDKPILHTIIEKFAGQGFINITICVNYKSHVIKNYFGDGSKFNVNIDYIIEEERMGTAGALSLLKERPRVPFFVMNGDLLTNINFNDLLDFHINNSAAGTMCVREYDFQVPYGVVKVENSTILSITEKPVHKFFVNAGIYMLNSECLESIPDSNFYDMPTFFQDLNDLKKRTVSFPLREYWIDIGEIEEYEKANREFDEVFSV
jgi:dTDP-glucose pyrophosphorylase/predicted transcriptional regulator